MSTTIWPYISDVELKKEEDASLAKELEWLLDSLQETLASLKVGLEECYALLAPIEPGSTLAVSSSRSESVKGYITRVGTRVVKGTLNLRLRSYRPTQLLLNPEKPLVLTPLVNLRNLLNQSLDCVDVARWTGDRHSASFISSQMRLLHSIVREAHSTLKGPVSLSPGEDWTVDPIDPDSFEPPLPEGISLEINVQDASLAVMIRTLEPADAVPDIRSRFALAIGAQRRPEHDEVDREFAYLGQQVKVKEKVRVETADPSLMAAMAKLAALDHTINMARKCLGIVMEADPEDFDEKD